MTTAAPSTALATIQPAFTDPERLALAGFLAGYRGLTREAYALDLRQFTTWCRARSLPLFAVAAPTSSPSPATWKPEAAPAPPSPGGCPPLPGSTSTPSKKNYWITHPLPTSAVRESITNLTPRGARPQRARRIARRRRSRAAGRARDDLAARAERPAGIGGHQRGHRAPGHGTRAPDPDYHPQRRQGGHHPARAADRPGGSAPGGSSLAAIRRGRSARHTGPRDWRG
jgi:hypothetical protein